MNQETDETKSHLDFYDVVIDIESLLELKQGYEIGFTETGSNKYLMKKNDLCCTVGVVGNRNKGKTYILEKLSGIQLPTGFTVTTKGVSVVYPHTQKEQSGVVLIDTAGLETPLLRNATPETDMNLIARDKQLTELFLQRFVIAKSNVLIAVVGALTLSDQKLLRRIVAEWKMGKSSKLFVVHNLLNYDTMKQINEYVDETLTQSFTFELIKTETFVLPSLTSSSSNTTQSTSGSTHTIYQEKVQKRGEDTTITHLLMAKEGSEAGNTLNINTLNYLQMQIQTNQGNAKFAIVEEMRDYLALMSNDLFEEPKIQAEDLEIEDQKVIKLKKPTDIVLKKCLIDELGVSSLYSNTFSPKCLCYIQEQKLVFELEIAEQVKNLKTTVIQRNDYYHFRFTGEKLVTNDEISKKEKLFYRSVDSGQFSLDISLPIEAILLAQMKSENTRIKNQTNNILIKYPLQDKSIDDVTQDL